MDVKDIVFDEGIWDMKLSEFAKKHKSNGFVYMSSYKKALRSSGKGLKFMDGKAGEVVLRSESGKIASISISLYNKGDDGAMGYSAFTSKFNSTITKINEETEVRPRDTSKSGTVKLERRLWMWKNSAILLEKSYSTDYKKNNVPEFMRIRMKPRNAKSSGMANRSSLSSNVVKDRETGDVFIKNVPMIDQGQKGYCAVASAARVYRYYGIDIDQHELAQIANTGPHTGTSLGEMVASLKKVTRHVKSRVLVLYEYPKGSADKDPSMDDSYQDWDRMIRNYNLGLKEYARDIKKYNRAAKKQNKKTFADDYDTGVVHMSQFARECDTAIYREVMTEKSSYSRFNNKIKEYIDQGLPVGWCLQLGMFKEGKMPQMFGGHMRLIIGYNTKKKELIYTDSWGAGHEKKRMPTADAFCMTTSILVLPPTK
ncbi:MAG: C39 family peptidase [Akkermansiaceae bacterium]